MALSTNVIVCWRTKGLSPACGHRKNAGKFKHKLMLFYLIFLFVPDEQMTETFHSTAHDFLVQRDQEAVLYLTDFLQLQHIYLPLPAG